MTDQQLAKAADRWIREHRNEMVADLITMVNHKSVSQPGEGGYAFGTDCKICADAMMEMAEGYGFDTENDDYYNISILDRKDPKKEIGILGHLDVVPEGNGWHYEPYNAVEKDDFVIGRGSGDNKGGVIMALYAMRFLREAGIELKHTLRLICGFNEEAGMKDVEHYLAYNSAPEYTLVCDGGWAMCIGEKGILTADLVQKVSSGNLVAMQGGVASNAVADAAWADIADADRVKLEKVKAEHPDMEVEERSGIIRITARGKAGHAAFPEGSDNAIYKLAGLLTEYELLTEDAAKAVANIRDSFTDDYGTGLGIAFEDEISGKTTCVGGVIRLENGFLFQNINVRFAIRQKSDELLKSLYRACEERDMEVIDLEYSDPRYTSPKEPVTKMLLDTCHEFLGEEYEAFVMGGGTHARKFPNALPYGPMGVKIENPFGSSHGPDEAMTIEGLLRSVPVYAVALVRLDAMLS